MSQEGLLSGSGMVAWKKSMGVLQVPVIPRHVILCAQDVLPAKYRSLGAKEIKGLMGRHLCTDAARGIYMSTGWGTGAPALVGLCEELRALGAQHFYLLGVAGRLSASIPEGGLQVAAAALRQEGTSQHYIGGQAPVKVNCPSPSLLEAMQRLGIPSGDCVSTDAPYRETIDQVRAWQAAGCTMVDMETSALYAFAAHHQVDAISIGIGADSLASETWEQVKDYQQLMVVLKETVQKIVNQIV